MRTSIARFIKDESGATAIEYGLIAAGIAVAVVAALGVLTPELGNAFKTAADQLKGS